MTVSIVAVTAVAWLLLSAAGFDEAADIAGGFIPARIYPGGVEAALAATVSPTGYGVLPFVPAWLTPLSATLLHGGAIHLGFNMLMMAFCGKLLENAVGGRGILILYLVGGYAAALGHYIGNVGSTMPMIGASGAVSAIFGAYAMIYGERRPITANRALSRALNVAWLAAAWIGLQLLVGFASTRIGPGVAIAAHIGGFLAGLALARPLLLLRYRSA